MKNLNIALTACLALVFCMAALYIQYNPYPSTPLSTQDTVADEQRLPKGVRNVELQPARHDSKHPDLRQQLDEILAAVPIDENRALQLLSEWLYIDSQAAATYIAKKNRLKWDVYFSLNTQLLSVWSSTDVRSVFKFIANSYADDVRHHLFPNILLGLCDTASDLSDCIDELPAEYDLDDSLAIVAVKKMTLENTFTEAFIWAGAISDTNARLNLQDDIGDSWVNADPVTAFAWALEHQEIQRLGVRAVTRIAAVDPWLAQRLALDSPEQHQRNLVDAIIRTQAKLNNYHTVLAIIDSLPGTHPKSNLYGQFIESWALHDPHAAALHLIGEPRSRARDNQLINAARYWGERQPQLALAETAGLESEDLQKRVWVSILSSWSRSDIVAATAWVQRQPPSPMLDKVIVQVGDTLVGQEISRHLVISWMNALNDPDMRASMIAKADNAQYRTDEDG